jgi:hypothetical protein
MESTVRRMPVGLLDHIQTICARQDQQFISDVARILGLGAAGANDMRRKILGTLGTPTLLFTESNPWWVGTQCPIMIQSPCDMWVRCGNMCESSGKCLKHRNSKKRVYTDPIFAEMKTRTPFRHDDELYWVGDDGSVLDSSGTREMDFKVNLKSRTIIYIKKYGKSIDGPRPGDEYAKSINDGSESESDKQRTQETNSILEEKKDYKCEK